MGINFFVKISISNLTNLKSVEILEKSEKNRPNCKSLADFFVQKDSLEDKK